ncbi:family 47 glycoside hydrolase [Melampsora larici-populina 98AG31]|uniref:alpha-1,2-Mannosidase n=1 Tax=Melampsora larici-populina (strain 98AG31 / pathotype 3-4-7) TaxID=747676 RepID=F4RTW8_MELLP|nr:family 47 glycoside hydrolase [Melampsora larici-populina 98AG31]EGG04189.1 family 47 glycoside hydrolase [Melampsora larici-populina 98AG31]
MKWVSLIINTSQSNQSNLTKTFSSVLFILLFLNLQDDNRIAAMSKSRKLELRDLVKRTWNHGFDNYMTHAFPKDELRPISCQGLGPDKNQANHEINDVLGNFALTLIDSLDTFIVFQDLDSFSKATRQIIETVPNFDLDSRVQVFETTIRVLGGLLSGHLFASDHENHWGYRLDWYHDELLHLAKDLADRMMPAFTASRTGLPYARVNLRFGISKGETRETCTAGAGSLLLEFATLSRLTNIPTYEQVARKALYALWNRRSELDLFGNTIDVQTGAWSYGIASIGAGIDSYYEYLLKSYVLLQDDSYLKLWEAAYKSVMTYIRSSDGFWYRGVNMQTGSIASLTIDSLAAFFPGLQILAGDIEGAIQSHMVYANLWIRYSGLPEVFDTARREATSLGYPLRPEFIESNYFLYRATKDEFYLEMAELVIHDLVERTWVDCGLACIADLKTGALDDRMNSFVLSETLKYLYLTFDEDNPINHKDDPFVFTTEGHILFIPNATDLPKNQRSQMAIPRSTKSKSNEKICSVFKPSIQSSKYSSGLKLTIRGRTDFELAKMLTGRIEGNSNSSIGWFDYGITQAPVLDVRKTLQSLEYLLRMFHYNKDSRDI